MRTLVLFRNDLRVADNPALFHACERGEVAAVFIYEPETYGAAAKWWLHHSLSALAEALGGLETVTDGSPEKISQLAKQHGADAVFWNRRYEPDGIARDTELKSGLKDKGIGAESFAGNLLFEPWTVKTQTGTQFKVFSPFWRNCLANHTPAQPLPAPEVRNLSQMPNVAALDLLPCSPNWAIGFDEPWTPGEEGANARFQAFLDEELLGYKTGRDRPDQSHVSRLSPHLHFGEISPRQIWQETWSRIDQRAELQRDGEKFLAEIGWREFSHHLLFHFPRLPSENWNASFDNYPWVANSALVSAWQKGQTGYPLVDAGMRELWATGYMHNRVRMVVASFLIKHLRQDWRVGADWFWDTLLDADLANNSASWQWVAGCGADAAPYFRIFNPTTQAQKFDPNGDYIRRWCPEIAKLPTKSIFEPHTAPALVLKAAEVDLGETYPFPIVDHKEARAAALSGYERVKAKSSH